MRPLVSLDSVASLATILLASCASCARTACREVAACPEVKPCPEFSECRHEEILKSKTCLAGCETAPPEAKESCVSGCCSRINTLDRPAADREAARSCLLPECGGDHRSRSVDASERARCQGGQRSRGIGGPQLERPRSLPASSTKGKSWKRDR